MTNIDDEPDPQLEARLRGWGRWARETAPGWSPAAVPATTARQRIWPVGLAAALVVAVAGLTAAAPRLFSHHSSTDSATRTRFPAVFDGSLTTTQSLPGTNVTLSPPPKGAQAAAVIGWQQVMNACDSGALCFSDLTAHVYLADFAKADAQPVAQPAWIMDYLDASCIPFGQPPNRTTSPTRYDCRIVNVVDPQTGALRWSLRTPTR